MNNPSPAAQKQYFRKRDPHPQNPITAAWVPLPTQREQQQSFGEETRIIFVGTGVSTTLPHFFCTLSDATRSVKTAIGEYAYECAACSGTANFAERDRRVNTSLLVRKKNESGEMKTFLFDVGKDWKQNALRLFRAWGFKTIDALFLSHHHDDAANVGLVRELTSSVASAKRLNDKLRLQRDLNVFCTERTKRKIKQFQPWLNPDTWKSVNNFKTEEVEGIEVTPYDVLHGKEPTYSVATPGSSNERQPVYFTSYLVGDDVLYMSDVSGWPDKETEKRLASRKPKVLVIDSIDIGVENTKGHGSHLNVVGAVTFAKVIQPERVYLTGINHDSCHATWLWLLDGEADVNPAKAEAKYTEKNADFAAYNIDYLENLKKTKTKIRELLQGENMVLRPAYDGLCITIGSEGKVRDDDDD